MLATSFARFATFISVALRQSGLKETSAKCYDTSISGQLRGKCCRDVPESEVKNNPLDLS